MNPKEKRKTEVGRQGIVDLVGNMKGAFSDLISRSLNCWIVSDVRKVYQDFVFGPLQNLKGNLPFEENYLAAHYFNLEKYYKDTENEGKRKIDFYFSPKEPKDNSFPEFFNGLAVGYEGKVNESSTNIVIRHVDSEGQLRVVEIDRSYGRFGRVFCSDNPNHHRLGTEEVDITIPRKKRKPQGDNYYDLRNEDDYEAINKFLEKSGSSIRLDRSQIEGNIKVSGSGCEVASQNNWIIDIPKNITFTK